MQEKLTHACMTQLSKDSLTTTIPSYSLAQYLQSHLSSIKDTPSSNGNSHTTALLVKLLNQFQHEHKFNMIINSLPSPNSSFQETTASINEPSTKAPSQTLVSPNPTVESPFPSQKEQSTILHKSRNSGVVIEKFSSAPSSPIEPTKYSSSEQSILPPVVTPTHSSSSENSSVSTKSSAKSLSKVRGSEPRGKPINSTTLTTPSYDKYSPPLSQDAPYIQKSLRPNAQSYQPADYHLITNITPSTPLKKRCNRRNKHRKYYQLVERKVQASEKRNKIEETKVKILQGIDQSLQDRIYQRPSSPSPPIAPTWKEYRNQRMRDHPSSPSNTSPKRSKSPSKSDCCLTLDEYTSSKRTTSSSPYIPPDKRSPSVPTDTTTDSTFQGRGSQPREEPKQSTSSNTDTDDDSTKITTDPTPKANSPTDSDTTKSSSNKIKNSSDTAIVPYKQRQVVNGFIFEDAITDIRCTKGYHYVASPQLSRTPHYATYQELDEHRAFINQPKCYSCNKIIGKDQEYPTVYFCQQLWTQILKHPNWNQYSNWNHKTDFCKCNSIICDTCFISNKSCSEHTCSKGYKYDDESLHFTYECANCDEYHETMYHCSNKYCECKEYICQKCHHYLNNVPYTKKIKTTISKAELVLVRNDNKPEYIIRCLSYVYPGPVLFFVNPENIDTITEILCDKGIPALSTNKIINKEKFHKDFKAGSIPILVATDTTIDSLSLPQVTNIVNVDMPHSIKEFINRVDRVVPTGSVFSLVTTNDTSIVQNFLNFNEHTETPEWFKTMFTSIDLSDFPSVKTSLDSSSSSSIITTFSDLLQALSISTRAIQNFTALIKDLKTFYFNNPIDISNIVSNNNNFPTTDKRLILQLHFYSNIYCKYHVSDYNESNISTIIHLDLRSECNQNIDTYNISDSLDRVLHNYLSNMLKIYLSTFSNQYSLNSTSSSDCYINDSDSDSPLPLKKASSSPSSKFTPKINNLHVYHHFPSVTSNCQEDNSCDHDEKSYNDTADDDHRSYENDDNDHDNDDYYEENNDDYEHDENDHYDQSD